MLVSRARARLRCALLCALLHLGGGDFLISAGNWTHSTNMFSELHFVQARA